jgi:hypothetical protein
MLTPEQFCQRVDKLAVGKRLPEAIYLHRDALQQSDLALLYTYTHARLRCQQAGRRGSGCSPRYGCLR